jgi:Uma2 family endonuclease
MAAPTKPFTYDDWLNLPSDCYKYEVIEGELITRETPWTIHQRISGNLLYAFHKYIKENKLGELIGPIDVVLSMTNIVQPDLTYISKERSQIIAEKNIVKAPDLVIEIISEDTKIRDQTTKKTLYEKYGVKEYWIVYPDEEEVEQFILQDEAFELKDELEASQKIVSTVIDGFTLPLKKIFETDLF